MPIARARSPSNTSVNIRQGGTRPPCETCWVADADRGVDRCRSGLHAGERDRPAEESERVEPGARSTRPAGRDLPRVAEEVAELAAAESADVIGRRRGRADRDGVAVRRVAIDGERRAQRVDLIDELAGAPGKTDGDLVR